MNGRIVLKNLLFIMYSPSFKKSKFIIQYLKVDKCNYSSKYVGIEKINNGKTLL